MATIHQPMTMTDQLGPLLSEHGVSQVRAKGIHLGRNTLPWAQVDGVAIGRRGHFVVRAAGRATNWARIDMTKMTNVFTFIALVNHIIEPGKAKSRHPTLNT